MPEYDYGENEDAAVHAYKAYCYTLLSMKRKRRVCECSGKHDTTKYQERNKRMSSTASTGNKEKDGGPTMLNEVP